MNVLRFPFESDSSCSGRRLRDLREAFGERIDDVEVPGRGHSVLAIYFETLSAEWQRRVRERLLGFLDAGLRQGP